MTALGSKVWMNETCALAVYTRLYMVDQPLERCQLYAYMGTMADCSIRVHSI